MKFKIFKSSDKAVLEKQINEWLAKDVHEIKHVTHVNDGGDYLHHRLVVKRVLSDPDERGPG